MIFLKNDYSVGAHPKVLEALNETNMTYFDSYGSDELGKQLQEKIRKMIGQPDAEIHGIVGGSLTNKTCLSAFTRPYEAVVTSREGHIAVHETGAIEATGHRLLELNTEDGKISPEDLDKMVAMHTGEQMVIPKVCYITDTTELGAVYTKAEITEIRKICDKYGMYLYIDGARLAMALAAEDNDMDLKDIASLADAFYIGGGKCGALLGELVVIINDDLKENFRHMMRNNGALLAKGWLVWLQFEVLLKDGLYEELGAHCNRLGKILADKVQAKGYRLAYPPQSNMIFVIFPNDIAEMLAQHVMFEHWEDRGDEQVIRLVTSWASKEEEIEDFLALI